MGDSQYSWSMVSSMIEVCVSVAGGGLAVLSLLFVYPDFPNTKLLAEGIIFYLYL